MSLLGSVINAEAGTQGMADDKECVPYRMFEIPHASSGSTSERYAKILESLAMITVGERNLIANLANTASILYRSLPDVLWAGFYLYDGTELVLGPFHGNPACIRITMDRGVCGYAASERITVLVPDVLVFPGHIACDALTKSEVVVPLVHKGELIGVMDLDSPLLNRFSNEDADGLERIAQLLMSRMPA